MPFARLVRALSCTFWGGRAEFDRLDNQSITKSTTQSPSHPINQSLSQPINESITHNQRINHTQTTHNTTHVTQHHPRGSRRSTMSAIVFSHPTASLRDVGTPAAPNTSSITTTLSIIHPPEPNKTKTKTARATQLSPQLDTKHQTTPRARTSDSAKQNPSTLRPPPCPLPPPPNRFTDN